MSKSKINEYFLILLITCAMLGSQFSIGISNSSSVSGTAKIFLIEILVLIVSAYVIFVNLIFKRKIKDSSKASRFVFGIILIFIFYYLSCTVYRIFTKESLTGSLFLARVIIETGCLFLCLDYFKINTKIIFKSLFLVGLLSSFWQLGILLIGQGAVRGSIVLGNSNVYNVFIMMITPALIYHLNDKKYNWKIINVSLLILSIPVILLSGSRVGLSLLLFIQVISILFIKKAKLKQKILILFSMLCYIAVLTLSFNGIGNQQVKNNVARSLAIPTTVVNKILPIGNQTTKEPVDPNIEAKDIDLKSSDKLSEEDYVEATVTKSNLYRSEWNSLAKDQITSSWSHFLFGSGTSIVRTSLSGFQTPHQLILQYMLPFGLIGTLICYIFLFSPLVLTWKQSIKQKVLIYFTFFPFVVSSINQPLFGNMVLCFTWMMLFYAINRQQEETS